MAWISGDCSRVGIRNLNLFMSINHVEKGVNCKQEEEEEKSSRRKIMFKYVVIRSLCLPLLQWFQVNPPFTLSL